MKSRLIVLAVCLLVVMSRVAVAQTPRATRAIAAAEPPPLSQHAFANTTQPDGVIARLFAFQPDIPLGPVDVLKGYEDGMTLIFQRLTGELISITQANQANQITRDEAEYLIQESYQVAMMQHEVLSALHDSLQHDLAQTAKRPGGVSQSDTAVVVQPPLAPDPPNQARLKHQAAEIQSTYILGTVSKQGATLRFVTDQKAWNVDNPEALRGYEGHYVRVNAQFHADKGSIHITEVKMPNARESRENDER